MDKKNIIKKYTRKSYGNGKGGIFSSLSNLTDRVVTPIINRLPARTETYTNPSLSQPKATPAPKIEQPQQIKPVKQPASKSYAVRGVNITDNDLNEAANILFAEVSNRAPEKQKFEVNNIINTAINRSLSAGPDKGKSLKDVLQRSAQYQGYAPTGVTNSSGKVIKSQYQKVVSGQLSQADLQKLQTIKLALENVKSGKFTDTTKGATFYVHASDGTMWTGQTQKEALTNAKNHERVAKLAQTKFGTRAGLPANVLAER